MELLMFSAIGRDIQWASLGIAAAILLVVSLLLGVLIVIISRFCRVKEDPVSRKWKTCLQVPTVALADIQLRRICQSTRGRHGKT